MSVYAQEFKAEIQRLDTWSWSVRIYGRAKTQNGGAEWHVVDSGTFPTEWLARWSARLALHQRRRRNAQLLAYREQRYTLGEGRR